MGFDSNNSYMFSCNRNAQVTFVENPQLKIIRLIISVIRALPYLHRGSLEITLPVPLINSQTMPSLTPEYTRINYIVRIPSLSPQDSK